LSRIEHILLFDQEFIRINYFFIVVYITITYVKNSFEESKTFEITLYLKML